MGEQPSFIVLAIGCTTSDFHFCLTALPKPISHQVVAFPFLMPNLAELHMSHESMSFVMRFSGEKFFSVTFFGYPANRYV